MFGLKSENELFMVFVWGLVQFLCAFIVICGLCLACIVGFEYGGGVFWASKLRIIVS